MSVRITEQRIPIGYTPEDLGDNYSALEDSPIILIGYLPETIRIGQSSTYVAFVTDEELADKVGYFEWKIWNSIELVSQDEEDLDDQVLPIQEEITEYGFFETTFEEKGNYLLSVSLLDHQKHSIDIKHTAFLSQNVNRKISHLEKMITESTESIQTNTPQIFKGVLAGFPEATRELHYDLMHYIDARTKTTTSDNLLPLEYLASIVYINLLDYPKELKSWQIGSDFNYRNSNEELVVDSIEKQLPWNTYLRPIGVSQLKPIDIATLLNPENENQPYLEWEDYPLSKLKLDKSFTKRLEAYKKLDKATHADLFNLLRFPKSSISLLYQYLNKLKNRETTGGHTRFAQLAREKILEKENRNAGEIIATEKSANPRDAKIATEEPQDKELKANAYGKRVMQLLFAPFLSDIIKGPKRFEGKVTNANGQPIKDVRVDIYEISGIKTLKPNQIFKPTLDVKKFKDQDGEIKLAKSTYDYLDTVVYKKVFYAKIKVVHNGEEKLGLIKTHKKNDVYATQVFSSQKGIATTDNQGNFSIPMPDNEHWHMLRFVKKGYWDEEFDWTKDPNVDIDIKMKAPTNPEEARWMKEEDIVDLLEHYTEYIYDGNLVRFPFTIKSYLQYGINATRSSLINESESGIINGKEDAEKKVGCNGFLLGLIAKAWQNEFGEDDIDLDVAGYKAMMMSGLQQNNRLNAFEPLVDWKAGEIIHKRESKTEENLHLNQKALPWCLFQGFRYKHNNSSEVTHFYTDKAWKHGHMFMLLDYHTQSQKILRFESSSQDVNYTSSVKKDGPQFKNLGHINFYKDETISFSPGFDWWKKKKTKKWGNFAPNTEEESGTTAKYPYRIMTRLYVYDLQLTRPLEK